jgi:transcriptional regulator with XRE-family HTH domain
MSTPSSPLRPKQPADAFPDHNFRRWREVVLDCDQEALYTAALAERLSDVLASRLGDGGSLRRLATETGLSRTTISRLARCEAYPTMSMIVRLERALNVPLWPGESIHLASEQALRALVARQAALIRELGVAPATVRAS